MTKQFALAKTRASACLFRHASLGFCVCWFAADCGVASSQTPKLDTDHRHRHDTGAAGIPARTVGTGPDALINKIDTADLIKKGQKDAAVMFSCLVAPTGDVVRSGVYRGTRGSELLEQEVLKRLGTTRSLFPRSIITSRSSPFSTAQ